MKILKKIVGYLIVYEDVFFRVDFAPITKAEHENSSSLKNFSHSVTIIGNGKDFVAYDFLEKSAQPNEESAKLLFEKHIEKINYYLQQED